MTATPKSPLGRLTKVELREAWISEPGDFTPWLAQEDNIRLLGETIGIELEVESQEKNVGPFRADVLCRDTITGHYVLIENQLERTDHTHLGQLLTYAAGLDAVTIIWIAARFTDEHRAALDWLNGATTKGFDFFGLEVELWRIGDSAFAPKFNVVSQPNDWRRTVQEQATSAQTSAMTESQRLHLDFWTQFREFAEGRKSQLHIGRPSSDYWTSVAVGRSDFRIDAWNNMRDRRSGVSLILSGSNAKAHFHLIQDHWRDRVESALEAVGPVDWQLLPKYQMSAVGVRRLVPPADRQAWPDLDQWMLHALETMHALFVPIVKTLDASQYAGPADGEDPPDPGDTGPSA